MKSFSTKIISILLAGSMLASCSVSSEDVSGYVKEKAKEEASNVLRSTINKVTEKIDMATDTVAEPSFSDEGFEQIPVKLAKHVDGDTSRVHFPGNDHSELFSGETYGAKTGSDGSISVRYLLIDTPETVDPRLDGPQPFGEEASQRTKELLKEGNITLEFDIGEKTDRYGRLLAYVYVDGVSVQEILVREGLARVAYVYPPNTRHLDTYKQAEEQAKKEGLGIWSIENYAESQFKEH